MLADEPVQTTLSWMSYRKERIAVPVAYCILAIAMTWPVASQIGISIPSDGNDMWIHQWNFWWVRRALLSGQNPFYTTALYYPYGVSLAFHNFAWLHIAAWLPLQALVGGNAAYSLVFIGIIAFNAVAMYCFARDLLGSRAGAFMAGLVFGFWPYALSEHGHPNMMLVGWVPFALLFIKRSLETHRLREALLAGVCIALTGIARWHLLVMGGVVIALYSLYLLATHREYRAPWAFGRLAMAVLVAGIIVAPLATPLVRAAFAWSNSEGLYGVESISGRTDLLAYILPQRTHPLGGLVPKDLRVYSTLVPFVGFTVAGLAIYGVAARWHKSRFWLLAAVIYVILALGDELRIGGKAYPGVPMPYELIEDWFLVRMVRMSERFNVFLGLPVGVLAAYGADALLRGCRTVRWRRGLLAALSGLVLVSYCQVPYPTSTLEAPEWAFMLAQEPGEFAVLDLPMEPRGADKHFMAYQTIHGKPLVGGHVSRLPEEAFAFVDNSALLAGLREVGFVDASVLDVSRQMQQLADANIRYLVLHKVFMDPDRLAAWQDWLAVPPTYEDEQVAAYHTDPEKWGGVDPLYAMGAELSIIRASVDVEWTAAGQQVRVNAAWWSNDVPQEDYEVCLALFGDDGTVEKATCEPLSVDWPPSEWGRHELVRGIHTLLVESGGNPGTYALKLALRGHDKQSAGRPVDLGLVDIEAVEAANPLDIAWEAEVVLRGYDLQQKDDALDLTLWWQGQRDMGTSYKVFVHLIDAQTGEIMVQNDAVPQSWTYPTSEWDPWEVVKDIIVLPLDRTPPGEYELVIGLYGERSGRRVLVDLPSSGREADQLTLASVILPGDAGATP